MRHPTDMHPFAARMLKAKQAKAAERAAAEAQPEKRPLPIQHKPAPPAPTTLTKSILTAILPTEGK